MHARKSGLEKDLTQQQQQGFLEIRRITQHHIYSFKDAEKALEQSYVMSCFVCAWCGVQGLALCP